MASKKQPPKKVAAVKKPTAKQIRMSKYTKAVNAKPKSGGANIKVKPYGASWKADVAKKSKDFDKSFVNKYVRPASEYFGPLAAIKYATEAISGRDLDAPAGSGKRKNRLGAAGSALLVAAPLGGAAKKAKKVISAGRKVNATSKLIKENKTNKRTAVKVVSSKKRQAGY
jgi:hypothetical protein